MQDLIIFSVVLSSTLCSAFQLKMNAMNSKYPLQNDLIIKAALSQPVERTPVWLFRQAGRHLPEYQEYKSTTGKNFLQLLEDPKDVAECTMQPVRRYDVDAAILFSDILVVPQALGIKVTMPGGVGIQVPEPLIDVADFEARIPKKIDVKKELKHVTDSVTLIKEELKGKVPLIGFSAAPWTLMYYMVGGSSKKNKENGMNWLKNEPEASQNLLDILTETVIDYMSAQVDSGADLIQVFEAMGDFITEEYFYKFAMPCMAKIATEMKRRHPTIPLLVFPRGATYSLATLQQAGYDCVTMDTVCPREETRAVLSSSRMIESAMSSSPDDVKPPSSLQGNFDVALLQRENADEAKVQEAVEKMLNQLGPEALIANLGEGLCGKEDVKLVECFVNTIHEKSKEMMAK